MGRVVRIEREPPRARLAFDHPARRSSVSIGMWRDLEAMRRSIHADFEREGHREGVPAFLEKRRPVFQGR